MVNEEFNPTDVNRFGEELKLIDESIADIDHLYTELKSHFDQVKNSYSKGSLSFIERQTSNLVSLRTAKVSMIKERINIKKIQADLHLKNKKSESGEDGDNAAIVREVAQYLMNNDLAVNQIEDDYAGIVEEKREYTQKDELMESVDSQLEKRLKQLEENGEVEYTDNEVAISYEKRKVAIVVLKKGKAWKFGAIDNEGNVVKNYPVPDKSEYKIRLEKEEDGNIIAIDQNDKVYNVINLDKGK